MLKTSITNTWSKGMSVIKFKITSPERANKKDTVI